MEQRSDSTTASPRHARAPINFESLIAPLASFRAGLAVAISCVVTAAGAQEVDAGHYDGSWTARLQCRSGKGMCAARLSIADFAGTWQDLSGTSAAQRMCGGKKMPLTVQSSTRSQLAFTVFGDQVSERCPTLSILVKPVDARTLAGSVAIGLHASESPEVHASHSTAPASGETAASTAAGAGAPNAIRLERR